jgi:hypothetical protein
MDSTQNQESSTTKSEVSGNVDQPNSNDLQKFKDEILNSVKEIVSDPRNIQSMKDKTLAEMKKDKSFKTIFREFQSMRESGMSDKEIEMAAKVQDLEERLSNAIEDNPGKAVQYAKPDVGNLLVKALDLNANDVEVLSALSASSTEEQIRLLSNISAKKRQNVSPAIAAQPAGDSSRQPDLLEEYKAKAKDTFGNALIELKMDFRKRGLDIY